MSESGNASHNEKMRQLDAMMADIQARRAELADEMAAIAAYGASRKPADREPLAKPMRTYGQDYAGWVADTALAIEEGRFGDIDRAALADEVKGLGITERDRLESALRVLVMHLLKTKYQPEKQTRSWELTIRVQRKHLAKYLRQSPSLRPELPELLSDA